MDPFEPAGYIPIQVHSTPYNNEATLIILSFFVILYIVYLLYMLNTLRRGRY
jgi:hypothetical protein